MPADETDKDAQTPLLTSNVDSPKAVAAVNFEWSKRACTGHAIHEACLHEDFEKAKAILDAEPNCIDARFTYETVFNGVAQEGSGEAIHIAVSRSNLEVVSLLLERGAKLTAMVSRDHKPHYDVLHSAVFSEGRGGDQNVVRLLLERKAVMTRNLDKKLPLHIAFQTGNANVIQLLPSEDVEDVPGLVSPLEVGITMGKMSDEQLAICAPPTPKSLQIFIHHAPTCVPPFLERIQEQLSPDKIAECLTVPDIILVLRDSPEAAAALLDSVTGTPECQSTGWHGLPTRVSFAPRNRKERFWMSINPDPNQLSFYEPDHIYLHDDQRFTYPEWHEKLLVKDLPISDVDLKVVHVPNIICPTFFSALISSAKDDSLFIFENNVVRGIIDYTWWNGANDMDLLSIFFNFLALSCLVVETWLVFARQHGLDRSVTHPNGLRRTEMPVSGDFIGSCGFVELCLELAEFLGAVYVGQGMSFCSAERFSGTLVAAVKLVLYFDSSHRWVRVLAIFICWTSLVNVFTATEHIATILIPLTRVVRGLVPAGAVTLIGFCSVTHMFYVLQHSSTGVWPDVFFGSFATLFTARLPDRGAKLSWLELCLNYGSVTAFTIFFLNIFIGVITEQYALETERASQQLQKRRALRCLAFMYRVQCVPSTLMSRRCAVAVMVTSAVGMTAYLIACLALGKLLPGAAVVIILCQLLMFLASFQSPLVPWSHSSRSVGARDSSVDSEGGHYLWLAVKRQEEESNPASLGGTSKEEIRAMLREELKQLLGITELEPQQEAVPDIVRRHSSNW